MRPVELALGRVCVLELEGHHKKARPERCALHRAIRWGVGGADEYRYVREGWSGDRDEQYGREQGSDESHIE